MKDPWTELSTSIKDLIWKLGLENSGKLKPNAYVDIDIFHCMTIMKTAYQIIVSIGLIAMDCNISQLTL